MPVANILIATPTYGRQAHTNYIESVVALVSGVAAREAGLRFHGPRFIDSPLISRARNTYATQVLEDPSLTHLLFIDSDIGFRPEAVVRMEALSEPFVGCICPARWPDPARIHAAARDIADPHLAREVGLTYIQSEALVREPVEGGFAIKTRGGFAEIASLGCGLTLIRRDVLETMAGRRPDLYAPPSPWYRAAGVKHRTFQAFEAETDQDGAHKSEDLSFAHRWTRDCGGRIWACLDETISHAGVTVFEGAFDKRLRYEAWAAQRDAAQSPSDPSPKG